MLEPRTAPSEVSAPAAVAVQVGPQPTNKVSAAANAGGGIGGIIAGAMTLYGDDALREVLAMTALGPKMTDLVCLIVVSAAVYLGTKYGAQAAAYNVLDKPNVPLAPVENTP